MQLCWLWRWLGAKECREHSPDRNAMETKLPSRDSAENSPVDTLTSAQWNWLQTFDFQNHKGIHLCYFKPLSLWLLQQQYNTKGKLIQGGKGRVQILLLFWILRFAFHWEVQKILLLSHFLCQRWFPYHQRYYSLLLKWCRHFSEEINTNIFKLILSIFSAIKLPCDPCIN